MQQQEKVATGERTTWGRASIGSGRMPAMAIAVPLGVLLGVALGFVALWAGVAGPYPVLGVAVFALCLSLPSTALVYVLVVDRSTMRGAVERPEESVESRWYEKAAAGALTDVVLLAGLAVMFMAFVETSLDDTLILGAVVVVAMLSFAIRFAIARSKG